MWTVANQNIATPQSAHDATPWAPQPGGLNAPNQGPSRCLKLDKKRWMLNIHLSDPVFLQVHFGTPRGMEAHQRPLNIPSSFLTFRSLTVLGPQPSRPTLFCTKRRSASRLSTTLPTTPHSFSLHWVRKGKKGSHVSTLLLQREVRGL